MGIIEFHLHEPDFEFAPSKTVGGSDEESEMDYERDSDDVETEWESEDSGGKGGALVALAVLVVLGLLVGMKRRGGDDGVEADTELDAEDEVEVYD